MAEEVAFAIAEWIGEDFVFAAALSTAITYTAFAASVYTMREQQRRAQNAARNAYNASLKDRYVMVRSATEPRAVVLGRQRVSGPILYVGSYGTYAEHLVMVVALAGHQIDAVEKIYFDNELVSLDGSGNVQAVNRQDLFTLAAAGATFTLSSQANPSTVSAVASYGTTQVALSASLNADGVTLTVSGGTVGQTGTVTVTYQPATSPWLTKAGDRDESVTVIVDGTGAGSVTLPAPPVAGSVSAYYRVFDGSSPEYPYADRLASVTVSGSLVTVGADPFATVFVRYRAAGGVSRARVRSYLGTSSQAADASMVANLPGVWTSAHTLTGVAYLVCEFDYNADAFPSGLPNVSAVVRGALCYDPRTSTTAWSQNPALLMRYAALSPLLGRLSSASVDDASITVAANVCDQSTAYVVGAQTYTRALYTAGMVAKANARAADVLNDLALAMAGKWAFVDGSLRVRAGAHVVPLMTLDDTWLIDDAAVQVHGATPRADLVNVITGRFVDEQRNFIETDYPRVAAASYITADGAELPQDVVLNAVTFSAQAQQVAGCQIRDARLGLRVMLTCNMRAYPVQVFDTLYVTLPRFGWVNQTMEVLSVSYSPDGGIQLTLKQTDASVWALGSSFSVTAIPPNTLFPSPWNVPAVTGLTCSSGTGQLLTQKDGTIVNRIKVTWNTITDTAVLADGGIEVRYGSPVDPEAQWTSVFAERAQTAAYLTQNVRDGGYYLIKARSYNSLVKGPWCVPVSYLVAVKSSPPPNVLALSAVPTGPQVVVTWTPCTAADYQETEVRTGVSWASGTRIFLGAAAGFNWAPPATGSYTLWAAHRDTTGNESAAPASTGVVVTAVGADALNGNITVDATGNLVGIGSTGVQVDNSKLALNLLDASNWVVGTQGSQGAGANLWSAQPTSTGGYNSIDLDTTETGEQGVWWVARSGSATSSNSEGGIQSTRQVPIDHTKPYRVSCWVKVVGNTSSGNVYLGIDIGSKVTTIPAGAPNTNPYFASIARSGLVPSRHYLFVGYVFPSNYAGAQLNLSGVYDGTTGAKVLCWASDWMWVTGVTDANIRATQWYTNIASSNTLFSKLRFEKITGSEPSISDLLSASIALRADKGIADAATAATTALWSGVTGTGKPQNDATKGAPAGTYVGATLAENVESTTGSQAKADAAQAAAISAANTSLATKLNKAGVDTMAGPISLSSAQAIVVGTPALDSVAGHNGLYLGNTGIVGTKNGTATFSVGADGTATFSGALSAATGNFVGSVAVNGASYSAGVISGNGFWAGVDSGLGRMFVGNSAGAYLKWDGSGLTIIGAVINSPVIATPTITGIIASPPEMLSLNETANGATATTSVFVNPDGTQKNGVWYGGGNASTGASYWVRASRIGTAAVLTTGTLGVWQQLNVSRSWGYTANSAAKEGSFIIEIASDSAGVTIVSTSKAQMSCISWAGSIP